jgi:hypothetical protein
MNFVTLMVLIKFDNNNRISPTQELKIKEPKIEEPKIECNKSNNYYIIQFFLKNVCFFYKKT